MYSYSRSQSMNESDAESSSSPLASSPFVLFGFGRSSEGQLGLAGQDDVQNVVELTPLAGNAIRNKIVVDVASGQQHTLILLNDGTLLSCGNNDAGQLGRSGQTCWRPDIIPNLQGLRVVQVSCGLAHSAALIEDGHVFTWGSNNYGQLGVAEGDRAANSRDIIEPREINLSKVIQIACGNFHTLALCSDGALYAWGDNTSGQIGVGKGTKMRHFHPQHISSLAGIPFKLIVGGGSHSFALSVSGAVFGWGGNRYGQLGIGDTDDKMYPIHVKSLRSQRICLIRCGEDFTAALTKDGRLFTFGCGTSGQLGHGNPTNETLPKQVFELMGSKVSSVACGRCHTLAVVNGKLYSFGLAGSGQLGIGNDTRRNRYTPNLVRSGAIIQRVFAGADQSFALCPSFLNSPSQVPAALPEFVPSIPKHLTRERIAQLLQKPELLHDELETIFSNLACVNCSFLKANDEHYVTGNRNCGVDMDEVMDGFELLANHPKYEQIARTIKGSISGRLLPRLSSKLPDVECLRAFIILPWCPVFSKTDSLDILQYPFAQRMYSLDAVPWKIIENWWLSFHARHLNRVLKVFKQVISTVLAWPKLDNKTTNQERENWEVRRNNILKPCLEILRRLSNVNSKTRKLPYEAFYVNELQDHLDVRAEFFRWVIEKRESGEFSICNYPFIFNAPVKTMLIQADSTLQMQLLQNQIHQSNFEALFNPFGGRVVMPYFELRVARESIVEDTVRQVLATETPYDLKKPLKVVFKNEEAIDEGGVKKEFFMLLFQELLHPKYGMFVEDSESRLLWFANCPFEEPTMFQLVGILIGLAVHNGVLVPLPFPLALFKKLLDHPVTLEDLKELHPTEGRSLEALLDYEEDDFEDVFSLNFTISVSVYGDIRSEDLKTDGEHQSVTKENRQEYVDLYVDHKLNRQVATPFEAFAKGIRPTISRYILKFFLPQELREMVGGNEHFDWTEFEQNAVYHGEYWIKHPTIQMFWEIFHNLSEDQKKKFLLFLTGNARVPLLGMKELKIQIQPTGGGDTFFPVAHTCFNLLDLPKYSNADVLKKKLIEAIEHNQGFSLI